MQNINFLKMHGLGNDLIIINISAIQADIDIPSLVKAMSNRRTGIGCDQLIIFDDSNVPAEMLVFNADGSIASACGNATRCLALILNQKNPSGKILINVADRLLECIVNPDQSVSVNMGKASFSEPWMPEPVKLWEIAELFKLDSREIICVDVGNPHLVIFTADLSEEDKYLLGEKLEKHELFPNGVNVNFAKICENSKIKLKVWERGAGFTLACGSGACATYAAAKNLGFIEDAAIIEFQLGSLLMNMEKMSSDISKMVVKNTVENSNIIIRGPAKLTYQGTYFYG